MLDTILFLSIVLRWLFSGRKESFRDFSEKNSRPFLDIFLSAVLIGLIFGVAAVMRAWMAKL